MKHLVASLIDNLYCATVYQSPATLLKKSSSLESEAKEKAEAYSCLRSSQRGAVQCGAGGVGGGLSGKHGTCRGACLQYGLSGSSSIHSYAVLSQQFTLSTEPSLRIHEAPPQTPINEYKRNLD